MADIEEAVPAADKIPTRSNLGSLIEKFGTDALLLGALSAFGYCVAFAYEAGYASHFGYPTYLITPTPNVIVTAVAAVLAVVLGFLPPLVDLFDKEDSAGRKASLLLAEFVILATVVGYGMLVSNYEPFSLVAGPAIIVCYGLASWWRRRQRAKLKTSRTTIDPRSKVLAALLVGGGFTYAISSMLGIGAAQSQTAFFFLTSKPDFAVVRLYDNMAIAVRYDFQKQAFAREYAAVKLGDDNKELDLVRTVLKKGRLPVVKDD